MNVVDRAARYVAKMEESVSGQDGHGKAFAAACAVVWGFSLSEEDALRVLEVAFNPRCAPPWSEGELRHKVQSARAAGPGKSGEGYLLGKGSGEGRAAGGGGSFSARFLPKPKEVKKRQAFDARAVADAAGGARWEDWRGELLARSPVGDVGHWRAEDVLGALFEEGERVLVFRSEFSQGDFGVSVGGGGKVSVWRLGDQPGVDPERMADGLPRGGPAGLWFLAAPVSGKWEVGGNSKMTRRSAQCVTAWRYMVLESDEAEPEVWLPAIARMPLPIAAIYESGGRSVHALVRVAARSKAEWDTLRDRLSPMLTKYGCDGGAMSAVRLTRVPNVMRYGKRVQGKDGKWQVDRFADGGRLQRLLYLSPKPRAQRIFDMPRKRRLAEAG
jgi:hypothetical protein